MIEFEYNFSRNKYEMLIKENNQFKNKYENLIKEDNTLFKKKDEKTLIDTSKINNIPLNLSFCSGSNTSSNAEDGSPLQSDPNLSISSNKISGLEVFAFFID